MVKESEFTIVGEMKYHEKQDVVIKCLLLTLNFRLANSQTIFFLTITLIPQYFIYNILKVPEQQKVAQDLVMSKKSLILVS